ncbi:hypothetical protein CYMTET_16014 [Cymbomonas tetramitiformis]|uniref:Uncharacterized protein n=1 Tax=Cymbomonas tetramitiformis TaxID=36881 RepID=A0AAE0L8S1_9CHLO|nr:hypothetical protein CYMTET_16014 [Cymbomonas tetramitiformis]
MKTFPRRGIGGAVVASEDAGRGDAGETDDNQQLLRKILEKLKYVEAYVKSTGSHSATSQAVKRQRGGLAGFHNGLGAGGGLRQERYEGSVPLQQAYCQPAAEVTKEDSEHAALLAFRFQQAADQGAEAFTAAAEAYDAPEVLSGEQAGGLDLSAYGFAVEGQAEPCGQDLRDPELVVTGLGGAHAVGVQQPGSMIAFTCEESDGEDAAQPEPQAGEPQLRAGAISLPGEADRMLAAEDAIVRQGPQARADARERAVQESLAAREHSVTAALAAQRWDAEELFVSITEEEGGEAGGEAHSQKQLIAHTTR